MSIDPVTFLDTGQPGQFNRYAYTFNDPINNTDPTGQICVPCGIVVGGVWAYRGYKTYKAGKKVVQAAKAVNKTRAVISAGGGILAAEVATGDGEPKVRGDNVRPTDEPVDLGEQLAGEEILGEIADGGGENISGEMGDTERYGTEGTHDKVRGSHAHSDGTTTEVHGDRDRATGELSDTKFKDPPDNNKSRSTKYPQ